MGWRSALTRCAAYVCLMLAPLLLHTEGVADGCRERYNAALEQCLGEVTDPRRVAEQIRHCRSLYDEEYRACANAAGLNDEPDCDRAEARININWVMAGDAPAYQTYLGFRARGESPLDAVLGAQGHNPNAQASIRRCSAWASSYLASAYADRLDGSPSRQAGSGEAGGADEVDLKCLKVVKDVPVLSGSDRDLWYVDLYVENSCQQRVRAEFCVAFGGEGDRGRQLVTFQPGVSQVVSVSDPRLPSQKAGDQTHKYLTKTVCTTAPPFRCRGSC